MTPSQRRALAELWPRYGLRREDGLIRRELIFGRHAELILEIGFGMGEALSEAASRNPRQDFIGIEVHAPGIGALLREARSRDLNNVRIFRDDAALVLEECFADNELDRIQLFFPDPWPKKRHHKRRLVQEGFVQAMVRKLRIGGVLHLATDWQPYAEQMMALLTAAPELGNCAGEGRYSEPGQRPATKFERRGLGLGHGIWDLMFERAS